MRWMRWWIVSGLVLPVLSYGEPPVELGRMVVVSRVAQSVADVPASVTLISRSNIVEKSAMTLGEIIRDTPGVDLQGSGYPAPL